MNRIFIFLILYLFAEGTFAKVPYEYQRPVWSMGMGGVYTPFPRFGDMPTANPAALRHAKNIGIEIINLDIGAPGLSTIEEFQDLQDMSGIADINNALGKSLWTGFEGRASFVMPYFGFSYFQSYQLKSVINNPLIPQWNIDYSNDVGMTAAGAVSLGPDVSFGMAAKRITRQGGPQTLDFDLITDYIDTQDTDLILDQFENKGVAYGMDVALLYKSESTNSPTMTLVWKDIGSTTFQKTGGLRAPPHIDDNLIFGMGYDYDGILGGRVGMEYRHITTQNIQLGNKLHFGGEVSLGFMDFRAGINQGYMTYGFGLDLWLFKLEAAQYTIEMGEYPGQTPEPRLQISLTLDLTVDADFNISSSTRDGRKRSLKQRR